MATLNRRYLISPSNATIFTSGIPSNFSTPAPTGANTPMPQHQPSHQASGVNPLLLAATHAQNHALGAASGAASLHPSAAHTPGATTPGAFRKELYVGRPGQTPTSIRTAKAPEYFSEWKDWGTEEFEYLGAQVLAHNIYIGPDPTAEKDFVTRDVYNSKGPRAIHGVKYME